MDPLTAAAASNITSLSGYGPAGALLAVLICGGAWIVRYFASSVKDCHAQTLEAVKNNTEAFIDLKTMIAEMRGAMSK